jgi:hydrogenase maturation protease
MPVRSMVCSVMASRQPPAPILVFGVGNPSRGDDALGPLLIERLQALQADGRLPDVELLTDFQLQVEHTLDLCERQRVIIVDAAVDLDVPCRLTPVEPAPGSSWSTHSLSPAALASLFGSLFGALPRLEQLAIGAESFALGDDLSVLATRHLECALTCLLDELEPRDRR